MSCHVTCFLFSTSAENAEFCSFSPDAEKHSATQRNAELSAETEKTNSPLEWTTTMFFHLSLRKSRINVQELPVRDVPPAGVVRGRDKTDETHKKMKNNSSFALLDDSKDQLVNMSGLQKIDQFGRPEGTSFCHKWAIMYVCESGKLLLTGHGVNATNYNLEGSLAPQP